MQDSKLILVTGVSHGLGRAMVDDFISRGHRVVGCARSEAPIEALRTQYPEPHFFQAVDVSREDEVRAWAELVHQRVGSANLLLNNAALINRNAPLWTIPVEEFSQIIDVNIKGVFHVIRHFVPSMIERRQGVIVNFSSGWGRSVSAQVAPYCATKWAVEGLTRALARELPAGMAAVPLNPGVIHTRMLDSSFGASAGSYPEPEDWARRAVPFLLQLGPKDNGKPLSVP